MSTTTDNLLDTLRLHLPGSLDGVIRLELFNTIDEFCRTSDAYRQVLQITLVEGTSNYIITPPSNTAIARVISVAHKTMGLAWTVYDPASDTLLLSSTPTANDVAETLFVTVSLTPVQAGLSNLDDWLPSDMWQNNYQAILDGTLSRMMVHYAKPYSSKDLAVYHAHRFRNAMALARNEANTGPVRGAQTWMYPNRTCGVPVAVAPIFAGPPGPPGSGIDEDIGIEVVTRASLASVVIPVNVTHVTTHGFATENDGGGARYKRVSGVTAGGFRSLDRFMPDGTIDAVNGGYWGLIDLDLDFRVFGAKATTGVLADQQQNVQCLRDGFDYFRGRGRGRMRVEELYELDTAKLAVTPGAGNSASLAPAVPGNFTLTTSSKERFGFKVTGAELLEETKRNCTVLFINDVSNVTVKIGIVGSGQASGTGEYPGAIYIVQPVTPSREMRDLDFELFLDNFKTNWWVRIENHSWDGNSRNSGAAIKNIRFHDCMIQSRDGNCNGPDTLTQSSHVIHVMGMINGLSGIVENVNIDRCDFDCYYIKGAVAIWQGVRRVRIRDCTIRDAGQAPYFAAQAHVNRTAIICYSSMGSWLYQYGQTGWNGDICIDNCTILNPAECGVYTATCTSIIINHIRISGQSVVEVGSLPRAAIALGGCANARLVQPVIDSCARGIIWNVYPHYYDPPAGDPVAGDPQPDYPNSLPVTYERSCVMVQPRVTNIKANGAGIQIEATTAGIVGITDPSHPGVPLSGYHGAVFIIDPYIQGSAATTTGLSVWSETTTLGFKTLMVKGGFFSAAAYDIRVWGNGATHTHNNSLFMGCRMEGAGIGFSCVAAAGNLSVTDTVCNMTNRPADGNGWDIRNSRFLRLVQNGSMNRVSAGTTGACWSSAGATAQVCARNWFSGVDDNRKVISSGANRLGIDTPAVVGEYDYAELFSPTYSAGQVTYAYQYIGGAWRTLKTAA